MKTDIQGVGRQSYGLEGKAENKIAWGWVINRRKILPVRANTLGKVKNNYFSMDYLGTGGSFWHVGVRGAK